MPLVVQVLNRDVHQEKQRYAVSILACLIAALLLHWDKIAYGTPEQALAAASLIFVESNATYMLYFAKSGMRAGLIKAIGGRSNLVEPLTEVPQPIVVEEGEKTQ